MVVKNVGVLKFLRVPLLASLVEVAAARARLCGFCHDCMSLKGRILIDGYDLAKLQLGSVRRQIGIVPQDSLFLKVQ